MSRLSNYTMRSRGVRTTTGFSQEIKTISLEFTFPIDEHGHNKLAFYAPTFYSSNGCFASSDADSAADVLDDFVSLGYDVEVVHTPTPDEGDPRLLIRTKAAPYKVLIF